MPKTSSGSAKSADSLASDNRDLRARVAKLERLLTAQQKTTATLKAKAEREGLATSPNVAVFGAAVRLEQIVAARTQEVEQKSRALQAANAVLEDLTGNLDQIVRNRTRALVASEEQLRKRNADLRRLNKVKTEFISIAAHELRTPMTSIVGYIELMLEGRYGELPEQASTRLLTVQRNSRRLVRLIEDLLDVTRLDTGRVNLRRARVSLASIMSAVVEELEPLARARDHKLRWICESEPTLDGDADKLHQIASNLIANAIRYTESGGQIDVTLDDAPGDKYPGAWARLRVRDNGIGIPEELRLRMFEPFTDFRSIEHHTSNVPDSAGLGLYVARGLVELHGGLILVESEVGEFSEFTVLLPLVSAEEALAAGESEGSEGELTPT